MALPAHEELHLPPRLQRVQVRSLLIVRARTMAATARAPQQGSQDSVGHPSGQLAAREEAPAHGLTEIWDPRPHAGRGGQGDIVQNVWKLKLVWDHAGTGTVRSRPIHQQIERAESRLNKLNAVEAARLEAASAFLRLNQPRPDSVGRAAIQAAVQLNEQVANQLSQEAAQHRTHLAQQNRATKGRRAGALVPSRSTRGQTQRTAMATQAMAVADQAREDEEEALEQARGPEGRQTLHDRCVEAREMANQLLAAVATQNPGFFELVRDRLGQWRQATEEAAMQRRHTADSVHRTAWLDSRPRSMGRGGVRRSRSLHGMAGPKPGLAPGRSHSDRMHDR
jgi:hypothetical protein